MTGKKENKQEDLVVLTREEYEAVEAEFLGISVECLRAIRTPPKKWRRPAKRLKGNKYVKFTPNPENT